MREGEMDPGLYDFRPYRDRAKVQWPGGKTVAVWVSPNIEFYELDPPANPHRKSWTKPHPDVVGYSHRDHGNRVGHYRLAEVMERHGFKGSVSLSVAMCQHCPEIIDQVNALGSGSASMAMSTTGTPTTKATSVSVARRPRSLESVLFIARYLRGCGRVARSRCR